MRVSILARIFFFTLLLAQLIAPSEARLMQNTSIRFKDPSPVVNENNQITLVVVDSNGQQISGLAFESGSPDIAAADSQTGVVRGLQRGFATVTARRGNESVSVFVAVARVEGRSGAKAPGDAKSDVGGRIYLTNPLKNVILKKDSFFAPPSVFAGKEGMSGFSSMKQNRTDALFAGPTAVAIDNGPRGGVYITDTLNHSIRKIGFNDEVTTVIGNGSPGANTGNVVPFAQTQFRSPRGAAADAGGDLFIADTDNHAVYIADFAKREVRLLAGEPGASGKADGSGRAARFFRPVGIDVSKDGKSIGVADTGNNRCRLISRDGTVTTISSKRSNASGGLIGNSSSIDQIADEIAFDAPQSVSFDEAGNLYVVDNAGVRIVTAALGPAPKVAPLAQPGSIGKAESVVVRGTQAIVLDSGSSGDDEIKIVTVGEPEILGLSRDADGLEGGSEVLVTGRNFAPETQVFLGDRMVTDVSVESATRIRFIAPAQSAPGTRTLSVRTRGGTAQRDFRVLAKPLAELADGEITTVAGGVSFLGDGGKASRAALNLFRSGIITGGVIVDGAGNLFIADAANNRIRRIDGVGVITTVAGNGTAGFNGDGGQAVNASLNFPTGIAVDGAGNLFIADRENHRVRRVDAATGDITTVAGNGEGTFGGDGGPALNASLARPTALAVDGSGNLLIADMDNNRVRRVDIAAKTIITIAGSGKGGFGGDGGPAASADLKSPTGIAVGQSGNIFIADSENGRIRKVTQATGVITTVAGNGKSDSTGDGRPAVDASLLFPFAVALDAGENLFIADAFDNRIRRVDSATQIITAVAGNGDGGFAGDGGSALQANLKNPAGVAADGAGNIYIADCLNGRVRRVDGALKIDTVAGGGDFVFGGDGGPAVQAGLNVPMGIALDGAGNLFIADVLNSRIRRVEASTKIVTTIAGNGGFGFDGDGVSASDASLNEPTGLAIDESGNIFVADSSNHRIRRVDAATKIITTVAGDGNPDFSGDGSQAVKAQLSEPVEVAINRAGDLFIADRLNNRIRRIDAKSRIIRTIAGNGKRGFGGDGETAVGAALFSPLDAAADGAGNIFIADSFNNRIRKVDAKGIITTVAGGGLGGDGGPALRADLELPSGIALDASGNLFIAEFLRNRIRKVDAATGIITTAAGNGEFGYRGDNGRAESASFAAPSQLAIDADGNLYITDAGNNAVRVVKGIAKGTGRPAPTISNASFNKPNLIVTGSGFGASGAMVTVNGKDVSSLIVNQTDASIALKGSKKKFNLRKGSNQIVAVVNGIASNAFMLHL